MTLTKIHFLQTEPGPGQYEPKDVNVKPPAQAKKSPGFLSSAMRNDKMATKFFTGNFVRSVYSPLIELFRCLTSKIFPVLLQISPES